MTEFNYAEPDRRTFGPFHPAPGIEELDLNSLELNRHLVKTLSPQWLIEPRSITQVTPFNNNDFVEFAASALTFNNQEVTAIRIAERYSEILIGMGVRWKSLIDGVPMVGFIHHAEDPRLFVFNNEIWIYYQSLNTMTMQNEIFIFSPKSNQYFQVLSPFEFTGKNWVPWGEGDDLRFIYALDPFTPIVVLGNSGENKLITRIDASATNLEPNLERGFTIDQATRSYGALRGGSSLHRLDSESFIGAAHYVAEGDNLKSHQMHIYTVHATTYTIINKPITTLLPHLLVAPFGLEVLPDLIRIHYSVSTGSVHNRGGWVSNFFADFDATELRKYLVQD